MNNLSWFIYLTEIIENFKITIGILLVFSPLVLGFVCLATIMVFYNEDDTKSIISKYLKIRYLFIYVGLGLIECILPSQKTMIMIMASEYSEQIINSKKFQGIADPALDLLKKFIEKETAELDKK